MSGATGAATTVTATTELVAFLGHTAIVAKLDVLFVRSPSYVEFSEGFGIFNLQGLPVPWPASQEGETDVLVQGHATTAGPTAATTPFNVSTTHDCYTATSSVHEVRQLQNLAKIKSFASKFAQFTSNLFWVLVAFAAILILQVRPERSCTLQPAVQRIP